MKKLLMPSFIWLVVVVALATCSKLSALTVGDSWNSSGVFSGNSWTVTLTVTSVVVHTDGTTEVQFGATHTASASVIRGVQVYRWNGSGGSAEGLENRNTSGASGTFLPITVTTTTSKPKMHIDIYGQDTGTDPTGSNNKHFELDIIGALSECKITVKLNNTRGVPVKYKLMKGTEQQGSTLTLAPGESMTQSISGIECGADYKVISQIEGYEFTDGQWLVEEGAVSTETRVDPVDEDMVVDEDAPVTPDNTVVVPEPENGPGAPANDGQGGTAWHPDSESLPADLLTKSVYREGVDKITDRLDEINKNLKKLSDDAEIPEMADDTGTAPSKTGDPQPRATAGMLGTAPTFFTGSFPTSESSFSFISPSIAALGVTFPSVDFTVDLAPHASVITVFRALLSYATWVLFYFLILATIKGATAGK